MEFVVGGDNSAFHIKEYTIRNKRVSFDETDENIVAPHFQAIVMDHRKKRDLPALFRLRYEDKAGNFVGLDKEMLFGIDDSEEIFVDFAIDVPESAHRVVLTIMERRPESFTERHELAIGIGLVLLASALVVLAAKGRFGWS